MPLAIGCNAGSEFEGAGDCVDDFSFLIPVLNGDPDLALPGRFPLRAICEVVRERPFIVVWLGCCPFVPAWTSSRCRARASLSIVTPVVGDARFCWARLSITFGFGPPIFKRGPAGSSTFSFASASIDLKCSYVCVSTLQSGWRVSLDLLRILPQACACRFRLRCIPLRFAR